MRYLTRIRSTSGFTLAEILISLFLSCLVGAATFEFFRTQNNHMLVQENISDMQQNLRASLEDIIHQAKNAGANLPDGIPAFVSGNGNPDTLQVNYVRIGGSLSVGDHTLAAAANPIHVAIGTDLSQFNVGDMVYLYHKAGKTTEPFTITAINTGGVSGWYDISHDGTVFASGPLPGDQILSLTRVKYYIDQSDPEHPALERSMNDAPPQVFADNIDDFEVHYIRSKLDTVDALTGADTVYVVMVDLSALTRDSDFEATRLGQQGRRHRTLSSAVVVRNNRF